MSTYFTWHPICIWTFQGAAGTQIELQRVQVNQCQFCVLSKKCRPFWYWICSMLVVQTTAWFLYWLAIKVWQFLLNTSLTFCCVLFYVLSRYFGVKAFRIKPTVCSILRTNSWLDDEGNCKHSAKCFEISISTVSFRPKKSSTLKQLRFVSQWRSIVISP